MMNVKSLDKIVFYDGDCGLCQRSIALIFTLDKNKEFSFAPLNGATYQSLSLVPSDMSTLLFFSRGKQFNKSDAVIEIGKRLGGLGFLALTLILIPRVIRDWVYDLIASQRKKVSCVLLPQDERFLK